MQVSSEPDQAPVAEAPRQGVVVPLLVAVVVMLTFLTIPPAPVDLQLDTDTSLSAVLLTADMCSMQFTGADTFVDSHVHFFHALQDRFKAPRQLYS